MNISKDIYLDLSVSQIPRLLGLMDRYPFSKHFGSFHRSYWLHRTSDFPSAISQMGVHTLALLHNTASPTNIYFQNEQILIWAKAGLQEMMSLQHTDGSFDEWYPNERGWAGPTGYILNSAAETFRELKSHLSENLKNQLLMSFKKAANHLAKHEETDVLSNHQAMALLAIWQAYDLSKDESLKASYEILFEGFKKNFSAEGWSLEYDGADPGYQTATISFLARLHKLNQDERIKNLIPQQLDFISYFFYPDDTFAGIVGTRGTSNLFHFGFEYWGQFFDKSRLLAQKSREMLQKRTALAPQDQEDHYLIYRLPEFLESYKIASNDLSHGELCLPYEENSSLQKHFTQAGIFIRKEQNEYTVINLKKGGCVKTFHIGLKKQIVGNAGWVALTNKSSLVTNSFFSADNMVQILNNKIIIQGHARNIKHSFFTQLTFIMFRAALYILGTTSFGAKKIKSWIRKQIMVNFQSVNIQFKREFSFNGNRIIIADEIAPGKNTLRKVFWGGEFIPRAVPQSRYFHKSELLFQSTETALLSQGDKSDKITRSEEYVLT